MIMANDDINVVSELMGHADIGTTMKYVQSTNEYRQKAAEGLSFPTLFVAVIPGLYERESIG
jgi:hypothetical protein